MDITGLDATVQHFCSQGLAQATHKTYQSALCKFYEFCSLYAIVSPFPVSEAVLCYFSAFLAIRNLSPKTIKTYLAGIRYMQVTLGLPEPRAFSSLPRLKLVQRGIERQYSQCPHLQRVRLPITPSVLRKIREQWSMRATNPDVVMLWAASTLCFFGFFRAGEITVPTHDAYDSRRHLSWGDIAIDNVADPQVLQIHLRVSKTDQLGRGVDVYVGKTGCTLCPVAAVLAYMVLRGADQGQFFKFKDGQPLTKTKFIKHVRSALLQAGLPYSSFAGHSFRIGAATSAAKVGLEDSQIRMLGRWNSAAFLTYIRTPKEHLAQMSIQLASS